MNLTQAGTARRVVATTIAALALLLTVVACGGKSKPAASSAPAAASGTVISLSSLAFKPMSMTVTVGTTVTWRNDEAITHTVTSGTVSGIDATTGLRTGQKPDGLFNASLKGKGDQFSYTFIKPGTYSYYCDIHFGMNASITVTA